MNQFMWRLKPCFILENIFIIEASSWLLGKLGDCLWGIALSWALIGQEFFSNPDISSLIVDKVLRNLTNSTRIQSYPRPESEDDETAAE